MNRPWYQFAAIFLFVVGTIALLSLLTETDEDPCANQQIDVSASVLGESPDDQDGLINRAIIVRGNCEPKPAEDNNHAQDDQ